MGSLKGALIAIAALWLLAACAMPPEGALDTPASVRAYDVVGVASWYPRPTPQAPGAIARIK